MAKKRLTKMDRWLAELSKLSASYGITLAEVWDGARLLDSKNGKVLGYGIIAVCGLYTAYKPQTAKSKETSKSQTSRDMQGFIAGLNNLNRTHGVKLELRASPMVLAAAETLEPLARLVATTDGYTARELQIV